MTMPHLMNCGHSSEGWCLDCVKELHRKLVAAEKLSAFRRDDIIRRANRCNAVITQHVEKNKKLYAELKRIKDFQKLISIQMTRELETLGSVL